MDDLLSQQTKYHLGAAEIEMKKVVNELRQARMFVLSRAVGSLHDDAMLLCERIIKVLDNDKKLREGGQHG